MSNDAWTNMDPDTRAAIEDNRIYQKEIEYNKLKGLVEKFQNGWERYNREPLFRVIIDAVVRGADPWDIIEKLFDMNLELSEKMKKILMQWPSRIGPNL